MKIYFALASVFLCFLIVKGTDDGEEQESCSVTLWMDDDMSSTTSKSFDVNKGCDLFSALQVAEKGDKKNWGIKHTLKGSKHYLHQIGRIKEDKGNKKFWMLYVLPKAPSCNKPPGLQFLSKCGVDDTVIEPNKHYLLWCRKHPGCKN